MIWLKWFAWFVLATTISLVVGFALSGLTYAHDWYSELKQPGTNSRCCGDQDCAPYPYRMNESETAWEAFILGKWWPIPPDKILKEVDSPDGQLHACCYYGWTKENNCEAVDPVKFRCVVVPQGSAKLEPSTDKYFVAQGNPRWSIRVSIPYRFVVMR
jgi:hypothetical protein